MPYVPVYDKTKREIIFYVGWKIWGYELYKSWTQLRKLKLNRIMGRESRCENLHTRLTEQTNLCKLETNASRLYLLLFHAPITWTTDRTCLTNSPVSSIKRKKGSSVKIDEFTLLVASWEIRARWQEIQRLVSEFKAN